MWEGGEGKVHPTGSAAPGLVVLGAVRKQVEQALRSKPGSSDPPPPWFLLSFLPSGLCPDLPP